MAAQGEGQVYLSLEGRVEPVSLASLSLASLSRYEVLQVMSLRVVQELVKVQGSGLRETQLQRYLAHKKMTPLRTLQ